MGAPVAPVAPMTSPTLSTIEASPNCWRSLHHPASDLLRSTLVQPEHPRQPQRQAQEVTITGNTNMVSSQGITAIARSIMRIPAIIDADDICFGPSLSEQLGDLARPGAKVGNASHREIRNPHQQVDRWSQSMTGEFQILLRFPYHRFFHLPL